MKDEICEQRAKEIAEWNKRLGIAIEELKVAIRKMQAKWAKEDEAKARKKAPAHPPRKRKPKR